MLLSKLTAKAQTTIPQAVRAALDLQDGDHLRYVIEDHSVRLMKLSRPVVGQAHTAIPEEVRISLDLRDGDQVSYSLEGDKVIVTKVPPMNCSFCGKAIARPERPVAGAPHSPKLAVAGPKVFICRDCVGMCISIMGESDPQWRDEKIEHLAGLATGETQKKLEARKQEQLARVSSAQDGESKADARDTPPHGNMPARD
jgi:antitoxin PrlF